jgi:hypothetical protein
MGWFDDPDVEAPNIPDPWESWVRAMGQLSSSPDIGVMNQADLMRQLQANQKFQHRFLQQGLDLSKRFQPLFMAEEKDAVGRRSRDIAEMMERLGPRLQRAEMKLQPEALQELGRQVLGQLKTEGGLTAPQMRLSQQDARSAQQARGGLTFGDAAVREETLLGERERRQRKRQDWGDTQKFLGALRQHTTNWGKQLAGSLSTPNILNTPNVQQGVSGAGMLPGLATANQKRDYEQAMADYNAEQASGGSSKWGKIGQIAGSVAGAFLPGGPAVWGNIGGQLGGGFDKKPSRYGASGGGGGFADATTAFGNLWNTPSTPDWGVTVNNQSAISRNPNLPNNLADFNRMFP